VARWIDGSAMEAVVQHFLAAVKGR
jgi:hypothetical protein